eukprot:scaffold2898_cov259-Skeletonema_marinoi.AAC.1
MPGPCPFEPMPSTTAQRAHNFQPLVRPCLSELPSARVVGMEVLDRIKRRFDGGDGDDLVKQNNQQNNQQRRESE